MNESMSVGVQEGSDGHRILLLASDGLKLVSGACKNWQATFEGQAAASGIDRYQLRVQYQGDTAALVGIFVEWRFAAESPPKWLVPGMFYGNNREKVSARRYPRFAAHRGVDDDLFTSSSWAFRSDRLPVPAVMAWPFEQGGVKGLATRAQLHGHLSGVAFGYDETVKQAWIRLNFPYIEEPVAYTTNVRPPAPERATFTMNQGERIDLIFWKFHGESHAHAYDPFVRFLYQQMAPYAALSPWMGVEEAAELAAYGLYQWHYHAEDRALYETVAFDREGYDGDRRHMHVGWVSGAAHAYALLVHGIRVNQAAYADAARAVMDHIVEGLAPAGILWGEWTKEGGFGPGWTNDTGAVHTRTLGEAVWFLFRALVVERKSGRDHPAWERLIFSHLEYLTKIQRRDGSFGTYYDPHDAKGQVLRWDGSGGLIWIPLLLEVDRYEGTQRWMERAVRAGDYYAQSVKDGYLFGAPEDVDLCPTSEDGYNAIMAYVALFEATGERRWLDLAKMSANWTMTFRFADNLEFSPQTLLGIYAFRTRGADLASPANNHLHSYGLIALPEMLRLAGHAQDDHYAQRTRDNLACFLQMIARRDGDFNAMKGMISERYYQTDWAQAKGKLLGLSHAWCIGLVLYATEYLIAEGVDLLSSQP